MFSYVGVQNLTLNSTDFVLKEIEESATTRYLPIIGPIKGKLLAGLVRKHKPKRVLEIGTNVGYSAILIAKELKENASLITLEIDADEVEVARSNIKRALLKPSIRIVTGDALDVLPKLEHEFDFVFIDAQKHKYIEYLKLIENKLHEGSVLVADNVKMLAHEMRAYLNHVRKSGLYESKNIPIAGDAFEVSIRL